MFITCCSTHEHTRFLFVPAAADDLTHDGPGGLRLPEMGPNFKGNATSGAPDRDIHVSGRNTRCVGPPHPCGVTLENIAHFGEPALIVVSEVPAGLI